jgi:hypothetical protein
MSSPINSHAPFSFKRTSSASLLSPSSTSSADDIGYLRSFAPNNAKNNRPLTTSLPRFRDMMNKMMNDSVLGDGERMRNASWGYSHFSQDRDLLSPDKPDFPMTSLPFDNQLRRFSYCPNQSLSPSFPQSSSLRSRLSSVDQNPSLFPNFPSDANLGRRGSLGSVHALNQRTPSNNPDLANSGPPIGANDFFRRRMSMAPNYADSPMYEPSYPELENNLQNLTLDDYSSIFTRRHSVAASAFPIRKASPQIFNPGKNNNALESLIEKGDPDDQFQLELDPSLPESMSQSEFNNGAPSKYTSLLSNSSSSPKVSNMVARDHHADIHNKTGTPQPRELPTHFLIVEFKAGRTDLFYIPVGSALTIRVGDLLIVEGDRGNDLGKVINSSITMEDYVAHKTSIIAAQSGNANFSPSTADIPEPKKVYRHALPSEVNMLVIKCQDELRALQFCQTRAMQHNLPMEVVDAEYQWDRRKLTFYFVSDKRIDFRELVRELFKIYKTRIWMCSVNSRN